MAAQYTPGASRGDIVNRIAVFKNYGCSMGDWNELFRDEIHILREPDLSVIRFARVMRDQGLRRVLDWGAGDRITR